MTAAPTHTATPAPVAEAARFADQLERFCGHLDTLVDLRGKATIKAWQATAREGRWAQVFSALMAVHYDPLYLKSIGRNYAGADASLEVHLRDGGAAALREAAEGLLAIDAAAPGGSL